MHAQWKQESASLCAPRSVPSHRSTPTRPVSATHRSRCARVGTPRSRNGTTPSEATSVEGTSAKTSSGQVPRPQRHAGGERGFRPQNAFGCNGAAEQLEQLLHQCQADSAAFVHARVGALHPVKPFEKPRHFRCRNARSRVTDNECSDAPVCRIETVISPSNVNFRALDNRLSTTFSQISRSTKTGWSNGGQQTVSIGPVRSTAARKTLASSPVKAARSVGLYAARARPGEVTRRSDRAYVSGLLPAEFIGGTLLPGCRIG